MKLRLSSSLRLRTHQPSPFPQAASIAKSQAVCQVVRAAVSCLLPPLASDMFRYLRRDTKICAASGSASPCTQRRLPERPAPPNRGCSRRFEVDLLARCSAEHIRGRTSILFAFKGRSLAISRCCESGWDSPQPSLTPQTHGGRR
jgi:hypothetical protein